MCVRHRIAALLVVGVLCAASAIGRVPPRAASRCS
jgi:hypothetical protein